MSPIKTLPIILACFVCSQIFAQLPAPPSVQSPNVAALGTFGKIPVSFGTGTPDISIPIYTVNTGSIKVPVSLRYHSGSVRPNDHPGWVGLGWSLESAGAITRVVHGLAPDELTGDNDGIFQNYYDHGRYTLSASDWDSSTKMVSYGTVINNTVTDFEADEFNFSFLNYSGTFILTSSGWKVISDKDIKVEVNSFVKDAISTSLIQNLPEVSSNNFAPSGGYARMIFQFTLTTEDGTKYIFGGKDAGGMDAIEVPMNYDRSVAPYSISAWHLIRIIDADKNQVDFKYHRHYPVVSLAMSSSQTFQDCGGSGFLVGSESSFSAQNISTTRHGGTLTFPVYLDEIIGDDTRIKFTTSTSTELRYPDTWLKFSDETSGSNSDFNSWLGHWLNPGNSIPNYNVIQWEQLNEINITNLSGASLRKYGFNYSNSTSQRLTLNGVDVKNSAGGIDNQYTFTYNNVLGLPAYGGNRTDHWGYFNDRSIDGLSFIQLEAGSLPNQNKNVNTSVITTGLLTKMTYPTGGYSEFDWEANTYGKVLSMSKSGVDTENGYASGCRIKEIRSYSNATAVPVKKTYYYLSNYSGSTAGLSSSGVLNGRPKYHVFVSTRQCNVTGEHNIGYEVDGINNTTNYGMMTQGSPIGYTEVIEKNSDGSYTKYQYSTYTGDITDATKTHFDIAPKIVGWKTGIGEEMFTPYSSVARERGKLLLSTQYTATNKAVQQVKYSYNSDPTRFNNPIKRLIISNVLGCPGQDGLVMASAFYDYTYRSTVTTETTSFYNNTDATTASSTKSYTYNIWGLTSEVSTTQSNGTSLQTVYKYAGDYDNSTYLSQCQSTLTMCSNDVTNSYNQCMFNCAGNTGCYSGCESAKGGMQGVCTMNYNNCIYANPTSNAVIALKDNHNLSALVEEQTRVLNTDGSKNLIGGLLNVYAYNSTPGAPIRPINFYKLETSSPLSDVTQSTINTSGVLTFNSSYSLNGYIDQYDASGNIVQFHKANGNYMSYIWGLNRTKLLGEVANSRINEVYSNTLEEANGWDANISAYDNAFSHSGKYSAKISKPSAGEVFSLGSQWLSVSLTTPQRYRYSCWVFSDAPSVDLYLYMKTSSETGSYTNLDRVTTTTVGKWTLLEGEFTVPVNITRLNLRIDNNGGGNVWFDDVRLYPSNGLMKTYTYDSASGELTSLTDANNVTTFYEYDLMNRLKLVRDQNGKIVKHYQYHYQNQN